MKNMVLIMAMIMANVSIADGLLSQGVFYSKTSSCDDKDVLGLLDKMPEGSAIQVCTNPGSKDTEYYTATPVKIENGVSYFYLSRLFKTGAEEWSRTPLNNDQYIPSETVFMCNKEGVTHSDSNFVQVDGLSVGQFHMLCNSWTNLMCKKEQSEFPEKLCNFDAYNDFAKAILDSNVRIRTVRFNQQGFYGFPVYDMTVTDNIQRWTVEVDFNSNGSIRYLAVGVAK